MNKHTNLLAKQCSTVTTAHIRLAAVQPVDCGSTSTTLAHQQQADLRVVSSRQSARLDVDDYHLTTVVAICLRLRCNLQCDDHPLQGVPRYDSSSCQSQLIGKQSRKCGQGDQQCPTAKDLGCC